MEICKGHDRPASWVKLKWNKKVAKNKKKGKQKTDEKNFFFSPFSPAGRRETASIVEFDGGEVLEATTSFTGMPSKQRV